MLPATVDQLPIASILDRLRLALTGSDDAVLEAPPGAGKTTVVPLALLQERWLEGRKILVLEPRRMAARAAATRMAELLGESVGQTVGYRIRLDTCVSEATRIEVITEGILARRLQGDPALQDVGLVIFDEFHERSLDSDLGLALTLQGRELFREEGALKVLVMSATLDGDAVAVTQQRLRPLVVTVAERRGRRLQERGHLLRQARDLARVHARREVDAVRREIEQVLGVVADALDVLHDGHVDEDGGRVDRTEDARVHHELATDLALGTVDTVVGRAELGADLMG